MNTLVKGRYPSRKKVHEEQQANPKIKLGSARGILARVDEDFNAPLELTTPVPPADNPWMAARGAMKGDGWLEIVEEAERGREEQRRLWQQEEASQD